MFSFGSLDHVLSASFWKTSNGWWNARPLNPSYLDYQLINYLYLLPATSSYEFVATFYDLYYPETYVIYPSGFTTLSIPLLDIISNTNDSREIYLLSHNFPIRYILVSKESPPSTNSYLSNAIKTINPFFANAKYELYSLSQLNLSKTELLPSSNKFLTAENITFRGDVSWIDDNGTMFLHNVDGKIYPVNNCKVIILVETFANDSMGNQGGYGSILYFDFDEGTGSTAYDKSGKSNDGTIYGATWVDGRFGEALEFDGKDDYLAAPNVITAKPLSFEAWVKLISVEKSGIIDSRDKAFAAGGKGFAVEDSASKRKI
ncbi:MAG: hypothetical protein ACTSP1_05905 [Candidatus Freyarchaeota archaeon]